MNQELPKGAVYGLVGALVLVLIVVGFLTLRDKAPTTAVNPMGREKMKAAPPPQAPPDWVIEKLRNGGK